MVVSSEKKNNEEKKATIVSCEEVTSTSSSHKSEEYVICPSSMQNETKYRSYHWRWYVLAVTCLLALSNAAIWISFSTVTTHVSVFYCNEIYYKNETDPTKTKFYSNEPGTGCEVAYWINQIFQIVGCVGGLIGIFITDKYGILVSTYCASTLNFVGIVLRTISAIPSLDHGWRLTLLYFGQTLAASAQPFFLVLSPKVAEYWFADNQRALANALSFAANPAGVVLGTVAPELMISKVTERNDPELLWLNILLLGFGTLVMIMTFGVTSNKPPTPPSASSASSSHPPFLKGLVALFKIPTFYIQIVSFGFAFALQWALFISMEPMLSELGYDYFGFASALSAIAGCASSIIAGCYVDTSKRFSDVIKGSSIGIAVIACAMNVFIRHKKSHIIDTVFIGSLLMLLGFFSIPAFPIGLELGIETTFPIAEASSSGVLIIGSQLMLFLMSSVMEHSPKIDWLYESQITTNRTNTNNDEINFSKNYQLSMDIWTATCIIFALFTCLALWPKYKRLEYEKAAIAQSKESSDEV